MLLDADEHGYNIQLRRVNYDREAVIRAIEQSHHPTPSFLIGFMRGGLSLVNILASTFFGGISGSVVPAGVCVRALVSRLASTWRAWAT